MTRFRKKPVVIEAVHFTNVAGGYGSLFSEPCPGWLEEGMAKQRHQAGAVWIDDGKLHIHTLEGIHRADPGDWIIQGVNGELYPCKPEIFAKTYELAE